MLKWCQEKNGGCIKINKKSIWQWFLVKKIDNKIVCHSCEEAKPLSLHHKTYKRMGKEKLNDLVLLCQNCHSLAHKIHDENKKLKNTEFYKSRFNLSNSFKKIAWQLKLNY